MKVPQTIRVGSRTIAIKYEEGMCQNFQKIGQIRFDQSEMVIDPSMCDESKYQTLFHEIIHAVSDAYSCDISEDNVDRLAEGLVAVLKYDFGIELDWSKVV